VMFSVSFCVVKTNYILCVVCSESGDCDTSTIS